MQGKIHGQKTSSFRLDTQILCRLNICINATKISWIMRKKSAEYLGENPTSKGGIFSEYNKKGHDTEMCLN